MPADRSKKNSNSVELDDKDAEAVAAILIMSQITTSDLDAVLQEIIAKREWERTKISNKEKKQPTYGCFHLYKRIFRIKLTRHEMDIKKLKLKVPVKDRYLITYIAKLWSNEIVAVRTIYERCASYIEMELNKHFKNDIKVSEYEKKIEKDFNLTTFLLPMQTDNFNHDYCYRNPKPVIAVKESIEGKGEGTRMSIPYLIN